MTTRAILSALVKRGKQVVQNVVKQKAQKIQPQVKAVRYRADQQQVAVQQQGLGRLQTLWHKFLPKVYYNSLASQLSRQAAWRGRRNVSLLAFMGLVVAQQNEEEDQISERLQEFIKTTESFQSPLMQKIQELSLDFFEFGQQIGQGCNAAVYEARIKPDTTVSTEEATEDQSDVQQFQEVPEDMEVSEDDVSDTDSDITVLSSISDVEEDNQAPTEFHIHDENDDIHDSESDSDISFLSDLDEEEVDMTSTQCEQELSLAFILADAMMEDDSRVEMSEDAVFDTGGESLMFTSVNSAVSEGLAGDNSTVPKFDLAVKMMFNYGVESNAAAILREMEREMVPARLPCSRQGEDLWENSNRVRKKRLPPHPNIVEMWGVFVDPVPRLPDGLLNYPAALPARLNPDGIGRNMTMFLVMKKYQYTLKEYLSIVHLSFRERLLLLVQLFEGVAHLGRHGVAHRDLKSDNILLDTSDAGAPKLVLSDFGCCLADAEYGLQIPFPTDEMDRGGNAALMAPEIRNAIPGRNAVLDYTKADVWAAGTLAYEVLGTNNPFYSDPTTGRKLNSNTYTEADLPPLQDDVPTVVKGLVSQLLSVDAKQRPSARQVADILHVLLLVPEEWILPGTNVARSEVKWWLITMATEVLLETRLKLSGTVDTAVKRQFIEGFNMNRFLEMLGNLQGV